MGARERIGAGELAIFEESEDAITFQAVEACGFVLGSAMKHPHPLVCGNYSVHTNARSLADGEARISRLGDDLRRAGRLN